jgi:hypothetical protein
MHSMFSGSISGSIRVSSGQFADLKVGDVISVRVIKRLIGNKWAVGIRGRTFPAFSDIELRPGSTIKAFVQGTGGKIVLQIREIVAEARGEPSPIVGEGSGLRLIRSALLQSALQRPVSNSKISISAQTAKKLNKLFARLTAKKRKAGFRISGGIAEVAEKGLDPSSPGVEAVLSILSLIDQEGETGRHYRQNRETKSSDEESFNDLKRMVKHRLSKRESNPEQYHLLQLFNHLALSDETWIVSPYRFRGGGETYSGLIKVLLDTRRHLIKRIVLDVARGESIVSFLLTAERGAEKPLHMSVYCSETGLRESIKKKFPDLVSILQNHGVECDDSIYKDEEFDGFSASWERGTQSGVSILT